MNCREQLKSRSRQLALQNLPARSALLRNVLIPEPTVLRSWFGPLRGWGCCRTFDHRVRLAPPDQSNLEREFRQYICHLVEDLYQGEPKLDADGYPTHPDNIFVSIEYLVYLILKEIPWEEHNFQGIPLQFVAQEITTSIKKHHSRFPRGGDWCLLGDRIGQTGLDVIDKLKNEVNILCEA